MAIRIADRAEAEAWSLRMEGYGGLAQPSPTIGQCLNGGLRFLEVECVRCKTRASLPLSAIRRRRDTEIWKLAEMPQLPQGPLRAAGAHDQADGKAGDHAVQMGASDGREVNEAGITTNRPLTSPLPLPSCTRSTRRLTAPTCCSPTLRVPSGAREHTSQSKENVVLIAGLTFPNYDYAPTQPSQRSLSFPIPCNVLIELCLPKFASGSWRSGLCASLVSVPKATMNKNCNLAGGKNNIRLSR